MYLSDCDTYDDLKLAKPGYKYDMERLAFALCNLCKWPEPFCVNGESVQQPEAIHEICQMQT